MSGTPVSDIMQLLAYLGGAIVLGSLILYGIMRSRSGGPSETQSQITSRLYKEEEQDRQRRAEAAKHSSNPVDIVERKTDTTG